MNTNETNHAPLPWRVEKAPSSRWVEIYSTEIGCSLDVAQADGKANADLIVRAVNAHADLVDALTEALDDWQDQHGGEPMPPWAIEAERLIGGAS